VLLQFGVNGLREARLRKANRFRAFDSEILFQVLRPVMLHHRVMLEVHQYLRADGFRDVFGDQHEMQLALVSPERIAPND